MNTVGNPFRLGMGVHAQLPPVVIDRLRPPVAALERYDARLAA